jgi:diguanylate cyclase (GGDEF)-like protein
MVYVEAATAGRTAGALPGPGILEAVAQEVSLTLANLRLRDMLLRHSVRDPLTGLCNRRVLDEWFDRELARAARHGTSVGVLLIDVDHFKRFNDSFGHEAGDVMLQSLATMLREAVRTEDLVCRYGGEEFLLILGDTSAEHVARRAADLCRRARELEVHDGSRRLPPVTLSIGVANSPQHAVAADALLRAADRALYAAKEAGRDRVEVARSVQPAQIVAA